MKWRNWKLGAVVALITGIFVGCGAAAVLDVTLNWKFWLFFISLCGKDFLLYVKDHPTDQISFDTTTFTKVVDKNNSGPFDRPPEPPTQKDT